MPNEAVIVFTAKSIDRILREGGTSSWRLDRKNARRCEYAICTRNTHAIWVEGTEEHQSAFLIGRVRDVIPCEPTPENHEAPKNRFMIQFSEFALVNIPKVWQKGDRNPVKYGSLEDFGINPLALQWERMPNPIEMAPALRPPMPPLTIDQAKIGLSLMFGVEPEAIRITING
jgi:hypothetical protein